MIVQNGVVIIKAREEGPEEGAQPIHPQIIRVPGDQRRPKVLYRIDACSGQVPAAKLRQEHRRSEREAVDVLVIDALVEDKREVNPSVDHGAGKFQNKAGELGEQHIDTRIIQHFGALRLHFHRQNQDHRQARHH